MSTTSISRVSIRHTASTAATCLPAAEAPAALVVAVEVPVLVAVTDTDPGATEHLAERATGRTRAQQRPLWVAIVAAPPPPSTRSALHVTAARRRGRLLRRLQPFATRHGAELHPVAAPPQPRGRPTPGTRRPEPPARARHLLKRHQLNPGRP